VRPRCAVLLPVRNGADHLAGWFESISGVADFVVALDDGSTDGTRALLESQSIVQRILANPVRDSYDGWDDWANRQRLVHAATAIGTDWCFFLDADQRLASDDAAALRRFVDTEAQAGFAYGFEIFRVSRDLKHADPRGMWVYRLFAADDARAPLHAGRLQDAPVPASLSPARWLPTSIRLQHLVTIDDDRKNRDAKYREADANNEWPEVYDQLSAQLPRMVPWPDRAEDLPLLLGWRGRHADQSTLHAADVVITAVVIAQNDAALIDRSVEATASQELDEPFEVIVVGSGSDETLSRAARFPGVRCFQLPDPALPGEARNIGLWAARGEYVTFHGTHCWLAPGSLAARVRAHDEGWGMVTGSVINGNRSHAGWASYFIDHFAQVPGRPAAALNGPPGYASYLTDDVRSIGGFPPDMRAVEDTVVNIALAHSGKRSYFDPSACFYHASPASTFRQLLAHRVPSGRALGRINWGFKGRWAAWLQLPRSVMFYVNRLRYLRRVVSTYENPELIAAYRRNRYLVLAGTASAAMGTVIELLTTPATGVRAVKNPALPRPPAGAPLLAVGGRTGEASTGLLAGGTAEQQVQRLCTLTRYALHKGPVTSALAPIATSATLTSEGDGFHVLHSPLESVAQHLDAARSVGADLVLQVQPGSATLDWIITRWTELLGEPDVQLLLDLRPEVAFADQAKNLAAIVNHPALCGPIYVRVAENQQIPALPDGVELVDFLDLQRPGTPLPHDRTRHGHVVYQ
jgi:glycosyltransferase involved in cell wall biosynthesis